MQFHQVGLLEPKRNRWGKAKHRLADRNEIVELTAGAFVGCALILAACFRVRSVGLWGLGFHSALRKG